MGILAIVGATAYAVPAPLTATPPLADALLQGNGDFLLQGNGDKILLG